MEIEFSKNGEGRVLLGIGCRKSENGYQKTLNIDDILDNECKIGDKIHKDKAGETLVTLVFNKEESIDKLIENLIKLKEMNAERTLIEHKYCRDDDYCEEEYCTCRLPLGC